MSDEKETHKVFQETQLFKKFWKVWLTYARRDQDMILRILQELDKEE